jgi:hypothetical protein
MRSAAMTRTRLWLLSLLPAAAVAGVVAFVLVRPAVRLSNEGQPTRASVAGVPCKRGTVIQYTYHVGAATYSGQASAASLGVSCAGLPTSSSLPILYLPSDPAISMGALGLAQARREAALATGIAFLVVLLSSAGLLRTMAARRA